MENKTITETGLKERLIRSFRARLTKNRYMPPEEVFAPVADVCAGFLSYLAEPDVYPVPKGFVLYGPTGCGKTTLLRLMSTFCRGFLSSSKCILRRRMPYYNARRIIENFALDPNYPYRLYDDIKRASLILDDLGAEKFVSRYSFSWGLDDVIQERWDTWELYHLPTFISTNIQNPDDMAKRYGERAMSRLLGMSRFIAYNHADRRIYFD